MLLTVEGSIVLPNIQRVANSFEEEEGEASLTFFFASKIFDTLFDICLTVIRPWPISRRVVGLSDST